MRLDVPGYGPEDVQVTVQEGVLTLSGSRQAESQSHEGDWIRRERAATSFERRLTLPEGVDVDAITANVNNGVLEVTVPHPEEAQPRQIAVSSGPSQASGTTVDVESQ